MRRVTRQIFSIIFLCLLTAVPVSGQSDEATTEIRFAHFVTDVPAFDVYLDGEKIADALVFGDISPLNEIEVGSYTLRLVVAGDPPDSAMLQVIVDLTEAEDEVITVAIIGTVSLGTLKTQVLVEDFSELAEGEARLVFYHAIEDGPPVNVLLNGDVFFQGVSFAGDGSGSSGHVSADVVANTVNLQVNDHDDGDTVLLDIGEVELLAGHSYFVGLMGTLAEPDFLVIEIPINAEGLENYGYVRYAHLATGTSELDFYLDDDLFVAQSLSFTQITDFVPIPAGEYTILVRPAGGSEDAAQPVTLTLEPGAWFTVAAIGTQVGNLLSLELLEEDFSPVPDGEIRMSIFHAMLGEGPVSISASGTVLIQLLGYPRTQGGNDGYESFVIVAGNYDIGVRSSLTGAEIVTLRRARLTAGRQYFMALVLADPPFVYDFIELSEIGGN